MSNQLSAPSKAQRYTLPQEKGKEHWISYHHHKAAPGKEQLPGIVFCGGFMSDMQGSKATFLDTLCQKMGLQFTRFDYQGHGESSDLFTNGTIGSWLDNTLAVLDHITTGPQIIIGSSMGGWLMLLAALQRPKKIAGMIGIASAPDFTETLIWDELATDARKQLTQSGMYHAPSCDGYESPYPITLRLIEEGRKHLLLRQNAIAITCPTILIHGMQDTDVPYELSIQLAEKLQSTDVETHLIKAGDHRMSDDATLLLLQQQLQHMLNKLAPTAVVR